MDFSDLGPQAAPAAVDGKFDFSDLGPQAPAPTAQGFVEGISTNRPTQGVGAFIGRNLPRMIGGGIGAAAGSGIASVPTAGVGGMAGEAARQSLVSMAGNNRPTMAGAQDVMNQVTGAGNEQAVGQGVMLPLGAAINAVGPTIMEAFPRIPTKYGKAALEGASTGEGALNNSVGKEASGAAYDAFEKSTGLRGMVADTVQNGAAPPSVAEKMKHVFDVGQRVVNNQHVDPQELYLASQYAANLQKMGKFVNPPPELVGFSAAIEQGKGLADEALAKIYPEYTGLRTDAFNAEAASRFKSPLPRNQNQSVNKLGLTAALGASGAIFEAGKLTGHERTGMEMAALPLLAMSPLAYGAAIKMAPGLAGAARTATGQAAQSLYDYWQQAQAQQQPQNPAPPLAPR